MTPEQERSYGIGVEALKLYETRPYGDLRLNAARASAKVVMAITDGQGKTIATVCGCGQPVGRCELCDGPRCWRFHPWTEPLPVPCGQCMVCAGRIVGGDGECYAASQKCDHTPTPRPAETPQDAPPALTIDLVEDAGDILRRIVGRNRAAFNRLGEE